MMSLHKVIIRLNWRPREKFSFLENQDTTQVKRKKIKKGDDMRPTPAEL
jgi:hypothetical protein